MTEQNDMAGPAGGYQRTRREAGWVPDHVGRYEALTETESIIYYDRYFDLLDLVVVRAALRAGDRVLDIGAGLGALSRRCAADRRASVTGFDPSWPMLEGALLRRPPALRETLGFVHADHPFLTLPVADAKADAVVSSFAFHHVRPDHHAGAIREMARVLRAGGRLVVGDVMFPSRARMQTALDDYAGELEPEHFGLLDRLEPAFKAAGLSFTAEPVGAISWVVHGVRRG
ncbi:MAG: class I SAM-dependent methyltransferase [Oceanicaulis sp.]